MKKDATTCYKSKGNSGKMSRYAMKSKSLSRNSAIIDDALRQAGTMKRLYMTAHICTIYRSDVTRLEPFSEQKAISLINKYHRKRQAHCIGSLFEDRLTLEKSKSHGVSPFRSWVAYKEIRHIYSNISRPEYFVLCIDSALSKRRYYEVYKCKSTMESQELQDRIRRAMEDPDKIIRDPNILRTENILEDNRARSMAVYEYQDDQSDFRESVIIPNNRTTSTVYEIPVDEPIMQRSSYMPRAPSPVIVARAPSSIVVNRAPSPIVVNRAPSPIVVNRAPSPISYQRAPSPVAVQKVYPVRQENYRGISTIYADPEGTQDVIYISYDSKHMAQASKSGPIYLYSLSSQQKYLPGRNQWGSTEHIDRNRLNAIPPTIEVERTNSLPDFYAKPQVENVVYTQPSYRRSPSPVIEYQQQQTERIQMTYQPTYQSAYQPEYKQTYQPTYQYDSQPNQRNNEVIVVKTQPVQQAMNIASPEPVYRANNYNSNNNISYINGGEEEELSDLTYISFDRSKGAVISERGPVYMYRKNVRGSTMPQNTNGYSRSLIYD